MGLQRLLLKSLGTAALLLGSMAGEQRASAAASHPLKVQSGVLTIDGLTVKAAVNLHIANFHYLYIYLPGMGTAVISDHTFAGAGEQKAAFHGSTMTVSVQERTVQLSAAKRMRGNRSAYVRFDPGVGPGLRTAAVSYGESAYVPAIWPEEASPSRSVRLRKIKAGRSFRSAKLCRPSPHGRELCATVREIVYKP